MGDWKQMEHCMTTATDFLFDFQRKRVVAFSSKARNRCLNCWVSISPLWQIQIPGHQLLNTSKTIIQSSQTPVIFSVQSSACKESYWYIPTALFFFPVGATITKIHFGDRFIWNIFSNKIINTKASVAILKLFMNFFWDQCITGCFAEGSYVLTD